MADVQGQFYFCSFFGFGVKGVCECIVGLFPRSFSQDEQLLPMFEYTKKINIIKVCPLNKANKILSQV